MANFTFLVTSCALLLLLLCLSRTASAVPVRTERTERTERSLSAEQCAHCSTLLRTLLRRVTQLLDNDALCYGIKSDKLVLTSNAETVLACTPTLQNSSCVAQRSSPFNESECLKNIMKDLAHYAAAFQSYLSSPLRSPEKEAPPLRATLETIQSLKENCSLMPTEEPDSSSEENTAYEWGSSSFANRQEMCKLMKGFHLRTITINRAMGYISSGEHRK